jgi:hypothetical protein
MSIPWGTHVFLGAFMPSTPSSKPSTPYETFCSRLRNIDIFQGLFDFLDLSRSHFALNINFSLESKNVEF